MSEQQNSFEQELDSTFHLSPSQLSDDVVNSWNEDTRKFYSEVINEEDADKNETKNIL